MLSEEMETLPNPRGNSNEYIAMTRKEHDTSALGKAAYLIVHSIAQ